VVLLLLGLADRGRVTSSGELVLVRHGETEWSRTGRHTSRTDLPLTVEGERQAELLAAALAGRRFARVLTSPMQRATETCRLAGLGDVAEERSELLEWDYGEYEGVTTDEIRRERPGWTVWRDDCPGGESAAGVGARVDALLAELRDAEGDVALFAHGHVLRVLGARWIGLPAEAGALIALSTATVSVLGHERETAVVRLWNMPPLGPLH
jgi:probable phosphoglycerate mutase